MAVARTRIDHRTTGAAGGHGVIGSRRATAGNAVAEATALAALTDAADEHGYAAVDLRALASTLDTSTVRVRRLLVRLIIGGRIVDAGARVVALAGTPAARHASRSHEAVGASVRESAHRPSHEGTGSAHLW